MQALRVVSTYGGLLPRSYETKRGRHEALGEFQCGYHMLFWLDIVKMEILDEVGDRPLRNFPSLR